MCNTKEGLFETLSNNFKPQYNETMKLVRQHKENAEEWMGRCGLAAVEGNYVEIVRQSGEQFIHRLNDNDMMVEIIKELTTTQ